jgi:uncharacterized membrane protein (DUF4010 family)
MEPLDTFVTLGISLGLGLLVGMQRERVDAPLAGVRTFPLITVFGTLCAMLAGSFGPWTVAAGLVGIAVLTGVGNILFLKQGRPDTGITTEIAILVMYAVGAYLVLGNRSVAVALGAGVTVLLHAKPLMHGLVDRMGEDDMRSMMQFVLISLVILPVLPDRTFGPFGVLNLRDIWWMVVLVVGISLGGYVALKLLKGRAGIALAGLIGGLVSSTATTVSAARGTSGSAASVAAGTLIILLASTVVFVRVLVEVFAVAPRIAGAVAPPIAILFLTSVALCLVPWRHSKRERTESPALSNPTALRPALVFGALYAVVLVGVEAARHQLGAGGVYAAAALSGLTDMDAITLSSARLGARGALPTEVVWRSIVIAALSNLAFKAGAVAFLGGPALGRRVAALFAVVMLVGLALLGLWPG